MTWLTTAWREPLEKVQHRATKLVFAKQHIHYEQSQENLGLPILTYCRMRGDIIQAFKVNSIKIKPIHGQSEHTRQQDNQGSSTS